MNFHPGSSIYFEKRLTDSDSRYPKYPGNIGLYSVTKIFNRKISKIKIIFKILRLKISATGNSHIGPGYFGYGESESVNGFSK